ncbi:hypothetical protein JNJ66_01570 [Candidatus Saccharibacteria bacterium]|nr:hypothetical protein [Candidatus Saccharibacteria bacterium]
MTASAAHATKEFTMTDGTPGNYRVIKDIPETVVTPEDFAWHCFREASVPYARVFCDDLLQELLVQLMGVTAARLHALIAHSTHLTDELVAWINQTVAAGGRSMSGDYFRPLAAAIILATLREQLSTVARFGGKDTDEWIFLGRMRRDHAHLPLTESQSVSPGTPALNQVDLWARTDGSAVRVVHFVAANGTMLVAAKDDPAYADEPHVREAFRRLGLQQTTDRLAGTS